MEKLQTVSFGFGEMLKTYRKRRRMTQRQLAQRLSVHANTVSSWELGVYLPATRGLVLEVAHHLGLDELETRQLLEASLTAHSPYWYIPLLRNPFFTGREEILEELHRRFGINQAGTLIQSSALHGLGGIGKTQIALEYAYRHALEYSAIFWIGAETADQIVTSLLCIAEVLHLPERADQNPQHVVAAVQRWLSAHSQWLLIWDNVENLDLLSHFLPSNRSGVILITTRCQVLGTLAWGIDLLPMEQEEGMLFLLRRAKLLKPSAKIQHMHQFATEMPRQYIVASELVIAMGGLPLALDQAGAYIEETQCSLSTYLELFRTSRATLLQQRGERVDLHPESVSTTFTLAITTTAQRHSAIWDFLRLCSLLQSDAIPEELFRRGSEHLGAQLQAACCEEFSWNQLFAIASSFSLLQRQPEEQMFSLHRLVQAVLLDTMTEAEREMWNERAIEALDRLFPEVRSATMIASRQQAQRLRTQALRCLSQVEATQETLAAASLAYKLGQYMQECGEYRQAEPLLQYALSIRERLLGHTHPEVTHPLNSLSVLYWRQAKYTEAEPLCLRVISIWEDLLGSDTVEIVRPLNNLAMIYWSQGRYTEAQLLYLHILPISERYKGHDHPDTAIALNNLAGLYLEQSHYSEAEPLLQRALAIREQYLGPEHPLVATSLNNLAELYYLQGKSPQAEMLHLRALSIREQVLAPGHPDVSVSLLNLGQCHSVQGNFKQAEALYLRALSICEQVLTPNHPEVALVLNLLANLHCEHGDTVQAEAFYQKALAIREQHQGQNHPETAQTLHDLAVLRKNQGQQNEAISLTDRALQIRLQVLGEVHPKTVATRTLYEHLVQKQTYTEAASDFNE